MSRRRLAAFALVLCLMVPANAYSKDVAELIPGDTYGYVVINRLAHTDGKIQALAQRTKLPIPSFMSTVKTQTGIVTGVDDSRSIAFAFLPTAQGPTAVLYVPVDDYGVFIEQLDPAGTDNHITTASLMGRPVIVGNKSGHAVVTWPNNRMLLREMLSDEAPPQDTTAAATTLVGDHDVAAVLTSRGVKMLTALGHDGLEKLKVVMRESLDEDSSALAGIEVYVHILNAIDSEVASGAVGLTLEEGGSLRVSERIWFQPTGKVAPIMREAKPHDGDLLSSLPEIPYVIAFGGVVPSGALQPIMDFSGNMMKAMPQLYGLTEEQVDKMIELSVKYFPDLHSMSVLLGVGQENAPLYSEMLAAMHVRDARAYVANYRKFWAELDEVIGDAEASFFKDVELEDINVDGVSVLKITMPIPNLQGLDLPNQDNVDALMEKLYGPGGITVYLAAADDDTVLMAYTDTALLRKALRFKKDGAKQISQEQHIVSTSKHLPSGAQGIGYWSPSGSIAFANRMMHLISGPDAGVRLPAFPPTPPVGWTMTVTPTVVKFDAVLPAEIIEAVKTFVEQVKQINGAGAADRE